MCDNRDNICLESIVNGNTNLPFPRGPAENAVSQVEMIKMLGKKLETIIKI